MGHKYFKFSRHGNFQILIQIKEDDELDQIEETLYELGFYCLEQEEREKLRIDRKTTLLRVSSITPHQRAIVTSNGEHGETFYRKAGMDYYVKFNDCLMSFSQRSAYWNMALAATVDESGFRGAINQFLALALAKYGVVGFWGMLVQDILLITTSQISEGDAFYLNIQEHQLLRKGHIESLDGSSKFARLDFYLKKERPLFNLEEIFSFFMTHQCVPLELASNLKKSLTELAYSYPVVIYPYESFKNAPKANLTA